MPHYYDVTTFVAGKTESRWVADRIGGLRTLILLTVNDAILFVLLAWHPGFIAIATIAFLFGTQSAANVPIYGLTLSESFGRENFPRAFGIAYLINLPDPAWRHRHRSFVGPSAESCALANIDFEV